MTPPVDLAIQHENHGDHGRYFADLDGGAQAELTYRKSGDNIIVINHTGVPRPFEGRGIALALVKKAVEDARESGTRIVPLCPYVDAQFRRHPEWSDLEAT
jgi:uncharacterized protein